MIPEQIFSQQTTKAQSINDSLGGIPEIDQSFAAAICAGMHEKWYKAARLKYGLDTSVSYWLEIQMWQEISGYATRQKWKVPKGQELLRNMCKLAILEVLNPELFRKYAWKTRSQYLSIKQSLWFKVWSQRYEVIYQKLQNWSDSACQYVKYRQIDNM